MKWIEYRASYIYRDGDSRAGELASEDTIVVSARDIGSGFQRAARLAAKGIPASWWLYKLEFSAVTS